MYLRIAAVFCLGLISVFSHAQEAKMRTHPLLGKIINSQANFVDQPTAFDLVRQARYVFIGEKHDNPEHHHLEKRLIQERFKGQSVALQGRVVFEMLDSSHEQAISKLKTDDSLEQMKSVLNWPEKGSWDWSTYAPLFQEALKNSALAAGNIDRAFISAVYKDGAQKLTGNQRFESALNPPETLKTYLLDQIFLSHCGMQSRETLTPMLHIQLAKDASMASAMRETPAAMLIAGGEHVRGDTGAPWHLRNKKADAQILIVQLLEVQDQQTDLQAYMKKAGKADLYWFTSATESKDYCAGVKGKAAQ